MIDQSQISGVLVNSLKIIETNGGDVLHAMKNEDLGYSGYGEAYFSTIEPGVIKGWKRHKKMFLNLIVPSGAIRFVVYDDRSDSITNGKFMDLVLSRQKYKRLTVPPMVWMAFQGSGNNQSMLLNIASIPHDPNEADQKSLDEINFSW